MFSIIFTEIEPLVELEVITNTSVEKRNESCVTLRCIAKAPNVNSGLYNPISLVPNVIIFFFNGSLLNSTNCPPGGKQMKKVCDLVIPPFKTQNTGKYYCMARNTYGCTTMGVILPKTNCPGKL